jgi:hypothetical protein
MVMRFEDMMVERRKTDTEYFGDLEAETTETEDVDNQVYLLIKSQSCGDSFSRNTNCTTPQDPNSVLQRHVIDCSHGVT